MSKWDKLSMADRAKYIKLAVQNGITDLSQIRSTYNSYADGGYLDWLSKVKEWKPGIENDIDSDNPSYDYKGFYMEDPQRAWDMIKGDPKSHFVDTYKRPNHPTFSDESIYSTPDTPGGHWYENYGGSGRWVYEPSEYTKPRYKETRRALENTGEGYLNGMNIEFYKRYDDGGPKEKIGKQLATLMNNILGGTLISDIVNRASQNQSPIRKVLDKHLKSSKEAFLYNGDTVYRDLDNNYYDTRGNKLADPKNDLLYTYFQQLRQSLKSGTDPLRYFKYYTNNYRHLQDSRKEDAKKASFPNYLDSAYRIPISKGKSAGVSVPKALIDSIIVHKPTGADIYTGLGMLSQETDFSNKINHGWAGNALGATNNERYVLPDQTFHKALSYAIRKYYRSTNKKEGLSEENYVKKYLNEDNISKNTKVLNYVNNILAEDLNNYSRFKGYIQEDLKPAPNFWDHTWKELLSGNYNPGDPDYNNKVKKAADDLREDPNIKKYLEKALKTK